LKFLLFEILSKILKPRKKILVIGNSFLSQKQLVSVLNGADIFLLPMNLDARVADQGLPTKLLEYQAIGKPIDCISNGEAARYINKTQSGLLTSRRQPEELALLNNAISK
jgi:glycosyltransferase involved in cell wall biosynthesis